jgi:hypothetical protein
MSDFEFEFIHLVFFMYVPFFSLDLFEAPITGCFYLLDEEPRSNKHGRKRPYMEKYDEIHGPVLRSVYLRVVYGEIRRYTEKQSGHLRSYTETYTIVYRRIRSP